MRRGAGTHHSSSPDLRELAWALARRGGAFGLWAGGASEDGGRRYVARSEQAARLARPKGAHLTSKSQNRQADGASADMPMVCVANASQTEFAAEPGEAHARCKCLHHPGQAGDTSQEALSSPTACELRLSSE